MGRRYTGIYIGLVILLVVAIVLSVCIGAVHISPGQMLGILLKQAGLKGGAPYSEQQEAVLLTLRMPRVLLGVLVGAALGISGAAIQALFRNPLAEPGLIGISSGATLFAALAIVLGGTLLSAAGDAFGHYFIPIAAFTGALSTAFLVYYLGRLQGRTSITALLLSGIAVNTAAFAVTGLLTYISTDEQLRSLTFWSLGSLGGATWPTLRSVSLFILVPLVILPLSAKPLNALALGQSQAQHLGYNIGRLKNIVLVFAALAVGTSVAVSGLISFVGLIVPHIIRLACGADNRIVLPGAALLGAGLLVLADLVSRTLVSPAELPIGIVTAISGSPIFIYMVVKQVKNQPIW